MGAGRAKEQRKEEPGQAARQNAKQNTERVLRKILSLNLEEQRLVFVTCFSGSAGDGMGALAKKFRAKFETRS